MFKGNDIFGGPATIISPSLEDISLSTDSIIFDKYWLLPSVTINIDHPFFAGIIFLLGQLRQSSYLSMHHLFVFLVIAEIILKEKITLMFFKKRAIFIVKRKRKTRRIGSRYLRIYLIGHTILDLTIKSDISALFNHNGIG